MQTLEAMRRRIGNAEDLYSVVRVMKALAAASIRQSEIAVESLAEYSRTVEAGLQIAMRNRPEAFSHVESASADRWGAIVFGSDQGLCGAFNEQIATFALEMLQSMTVRPQDRSVLLVGARVAGRLEDAGYAIDEQFHLPSTVTGMTSAVHELLIKIEELRFQRGVERLFLIHHRPVERGGSVPQLLQLLPVEPRWLEDLAAKAWPSRSLPTITMDWRLLFSALIREHLFVAIYRAFAETLASENANRLASMQAAEKNIQSHLTALTADYHRGRQHSITEELLDIVAGFETLKGRPERRARDPW